MNMETINIRSTIIRSELTTVQQWCRESVSLLTKASKVTGAQRDAILDSAKAADRKASEAIGRLESALEDINEVRHFIRVAIAESREVK